MENRDVITTKLGLGNLCTTFPFRPGKDRLNIKSLPDAFFVIRRDALSRSGFYIVDPQRSLHWYLTRHRGIASVAPLDFPVVTGATIGANEDISCSKICPIASTSLWRQLCLHDPVSTTLVINQTARPEFRNGQKASAL
jgi:hypothetical protein